MARRKKDRVKKSNKKLLKRMQIKLWVVFGGICVLFVFLIGKLMYIEYTSGSKYEKIVLSQQKYDSAIVPYQRGDIIDSKGSVLATSVDVYNVILDCKVLNANTDLIDTTVNAVTLCFPEITAEKMRKALAEKKSSEYVILAKKVSYEEMATFEALTSSDEFKKSVTGIWFEKEYQRKYPYGYLAASLIGFSSSGNYGVIGLENEYNSTLNGINGRSYGYINSDSDVERTVIEPTDGNTLVTTIDINIQNIVEDAILNWNREYMGEDSTTGSVNTAALVMNPNTGEIYAMADYPVFDLNNPRDLSAYFSEEELDAMTDDEEMDALNELWQNYTVTHTYEPGSTFKPFTVATGLETGTLVGNETYLCNGGEEISGYTVHCVNRNGHGMETIADALSDSCNDALMQMSYVIGAHNFASFQSLFNFGQKTGIDLPGEANTSTLIYNEEQLGSTINIATNSFGQNFNTTMVQLGSSFCSLINGGHLYQPHVVAKIQDSSGNVIETKEPVVLKETVSKEVSDQMKAYLLNVVANGTAKTAKVEGYNIGGKTGTAQKTHPSNGTYLVSFIGYAPFYNPEVVVYVIVDEPNTPDQAHSSFAQIICHNIMEQILPYLNIKTAEEEEGVEQILAEVSGATATVTEETNSANTSTESMEEEPPEGAAED